MIVGQVSCDCTGLLLSNEINVAKRGQDLVILVPVQVSTRNVMFTGSTPSPLDLHMQEGKRGSI